MGIFSFLGVLSPAHISLFTLTSRKQKIGTDQLGNTYYEAAPKKGYHRPRRWVIYNGAPEASKVPPEWHGWLHHQTNVVPSENEETYRRPWQQPYQPNMTGTNKAYRPPGHILSGGQREKATGDYEAWTPSD
ncbi:MAG: NADH:ubiquinone oxidoreductase subunit NDUFA12 [Alcanivorax sp.]